MSRGLNDEIELLMEKARGRIFKPEGKKKRKKKKNTETRIRTDGGKERPLVYLDCMIKTESG